MFMTRAGGRTARQLVIAGVAIGAILLVAGAVDVALAQGTPFGAPKGAPPVAPSTGIVGWIMVKQAEFYKGLSGAIRAAKTDNSALWVLFGLSFAYGLFHAAGPGHGKAVISSYVVANRETWWRGVVLSFASAMVQAAVAVAVVGIAAVLLNATAATMRNAVYWIEIISYSLIIAIGLRLVWTKGRAMLATLRDIQRPKTVGAAATPAHLRDAHDQAHHDQAHHDHAHHDHAHHDHGQPHGHDHHHDHGAHAHHDRGHDHDHGHHDHHAHGQHDHDHAHCDHDHGSAWGHAHAPEPQELAGPGGWKRGLTAIIAVGLRPCSGAILVLVFTLAQGLFWAGVVATFLMGFGTAIMVATIAVLSVIAASWAERFASTRGGYGMLFMRGIEVAAALLITAFGALLLLGYMASERLLA
jgi:nickel/cobalt transporter (NicO) family protein